MQCTVYLNPTDHSEDYTCHVEAHSLEGAADRACDVIDVGPGDLLRVHSADGGILYAERNIDGGLEFRTLEQQRKLEADNATSARAYMERFKRPDYAAGTDEDADEFAQEAAECRETPHTARMRTHGVG